MKFRYLGDMVLLSSVFRNLRIHFPTAHVAALADASYADVLRYVPDIDDVIAFPRAETRRGSLARRFAASARLLRDLGPRRRFDMVVDLADGSTSRLLVRLLSAPVRVGYAARKGQRRRPPYTLLAPPRSEGSHQLDHYLDPLRALGLSVEDRQPVLRPRPADERSVAALLDKHGLKPHEFIAVHPGARIASKCWPPASYARLVDALARETGRAIVLLGGPGERALADAVIAASGTEPVDLTGKLSFGELAALLRSCRLLIGNDTGPTHIAAAVGAPIVALFGLEEPARWGPVSERAIVVRPSMPCSCPFPQICRPPDPQRTLCVQRIGVAEVLAAAHRQLAHEPAEWRRA